MLFLSYQSNTLNIKNSLFIKQQRLLSHRGELHGIQSALTCSETEGKGRKQTSLFGEVENGTINFAAALKVNVYKLILPGCVG